MGLKEIIKAMFIFAFVIVSLGGALSASLEVYVMNVNVRPIAYMYLLVIVTLLSAIQIARLIEDLMSMRSPQFLLTAFFRMEDEPRRDVTKDPIAFIGLIALLLGGYILRPASFIMGILEALSLRPSMWLRAINKLLISRVVILSFLLAVGLALIERRYVSRATLAASGIPARASSLTCFLHTYASSSYKGPP